MEFNLKMKLPINTSLLLKKASLSKKYKIITNLMKIWPKWHISNLNDEIQT